MSTPTHQRRLELDVLRSLAVISMVIYHLAYDLQAYYSWPIDVFSGLWFYQERITAIVFLLLVGCSYVLSWQRHERQPQAIQKSYQRGCILLLLATLVSAATYVLDPTTFVRFGILHLIGVSILLLPYTVRLRYWNIPLGSLWIAIGIVLVRQCHTTSSFGVPLGCTPAHFISVDYFPMFPWFGWIVLGTGLGWALYGRRTPLPILLPNRPGLHLLTWPGRHALIIYLVHQPLLLGCLYVARALQLLPLPG